MRRINKTALFGAVFFVTGMLAAPPYHWWNKWWIVAIWAVIALVGMYLVYARDSNRVPKDL